MRKGEVRRVEVVRTPAEVHRIESDDQCREPRVCCTREERDGDFGRFGPVELVPAWIVRTVGCSDFLDRPCRSGAHDKGYVERTSCAGGPELSFGMDDALYTYWSYEQRTRVFLPKECDL